MIENTQAEDDIELSVKRFRVHLPKVEHLEVDVSYSNDALYQIGLLDKIGAGVEANDLCTQSANCKDQKPELQAISNTLIPLSEPLVASSRDGIKWRNRCKTRLGSRVD